MRRWYVWMPVSAGLLALVIWRSRPWEAAALAAALDPVPLGAAILINAVVVAGWAVRSQGLMAAVGSPLRLLDLIPVVSFANTINNVTPASSGEILRAIVLRRRFNVPYAQSTAVIVAERFWAIGIMLATALAASIGTITAAPPSVVAAAWALAVIASFTPSVVYAAGLRPGRVARWFADRGGSAPGRSHRWAATLAAADSQLADIVTSPGRAIHFVATTAVIFAGFGIQLWLVLLALGASISPIGVWAAMGLSILAGVVSALPFGLGAADAVLIVLLGLQGVELSTAGAAALLVRAVATLPLGVLGAASWIALNRGGVPISEPEITSREWPSK